ncbi:helix-turn-helix domain-containing protein [Paenibacillus sp. LMG 31461]|uniref:Helix-turn-helix domain-containing protein n=1 Tax=Paenibacillus plantarum TaxID=2654975 RepID=A0ABX1X8J4_9BACL|nr:helix-turn-helix domain-containing protein [Paenibacillus plantarum]NOU64765.1 helix-turn-helix domain-containing protein [Paenibacillus plantarum]
MVTESILNQDLRPHIRYTDLLHFKQWNTHARIITDYLLLYVQDGSAHLTIDAKRYLLKPGQFSLIQPGVVHQFESESPLTVMALHFELFPSGDGERLPMIVPLERGTHPELVNLQPDLTTFADIVVPVVFKSARNEWMADVFLQIIEHWNRPHALAKLQAHVYAAEIILELLQEYTSQDSSEHKNAISLNWVPAYMQYRLSEPLSVEEMARKAFMSRSYFSMLFRNQFNMAPHQYLLKLRLDYAKELLRGTSMPLQNIADSCGFSSVHHFSKMYKLRFGCPPSHRRHEQ